MPKVSIVTITRGRRKFIPSLIYTIESQTFPKSDMEWVIFDDGPDPILDLVSKIKYVKYYWSPSVHKIGRKRNISNHLSTGDYIFYFDDDDYSFPHRVECGVKILDEKSDIMMVGSSEMYMYDANEKIVYTVGPYAKNHATEGTWGFRREILKTHEYDDSLPRSTEPSFTKKWTVPMYQIGKDNVIIAIIHAKNTAPKSNIGNKSKSKNSLEDIIKNKHAIELFKNINIKKITGNVFG